MIPTIKVLFVFLAACNQLNKEGSNPVKKYAKAMLGGKAVRVICGYHSYAPGTSDYMVVDKFLKVAKTGESVKSSWIKANEYVYTEKGYTNAKNYAVLTHSGNAQYSRFPGFSSKTYTRPGESSKKIIRFRRGVEDGEKIVSTANVKRSNIEEKVPNYRLKATPTKIVAKKQCKDMVFNDENVVVTDGGEIGTKKVNMSKKELYNISKEYFQYNLKVKKGSVELNRKDMVVAPIVVSDACTDEEETEIAYSVYFPNKYKDITIEGEGFNVIVDSSGVKYSATGWSTYEEEEIDEEKISLEEAVNVVYDDIEDDTKVMSTKALNSSKKNSDTQITDVSVQFAYNEETGYYEPVYYFNLNDDSVKKVNCIDGTLMDGGTENE